MKFRWVEPGEDGITPVVKTITLSQFITQYYPWWSERCRKIGLPESEITLEECINDFIVVHWAEKVE